MSKTTKAKFWVGLAGAVLQGALQFVGPDGDVGHWLSLALAVVTAVGVYAIKNEPTT